MTHRSASASSLLSISSNPGADDWSAWREALPTALGELALWRSREKAAGIEDAVFVLFGNAGAATLLPTPKSINPLKRFKRSVLPLESWFIDNFAGEVP
ncbi:MAG: hypothetical protein ACLT49_09270 [Sutterella wadsworthensis]